MVLWATVKTTLEISDELFQRAKMDALARGKTFKLYVTEAIESKLAMEKAAVEKPWMKGFGKLSKLRKETKRIDKIISEEFSTIDTEEWK